MRNEDTYANDVKGYGTTYPCGWMGIKKPSGFKYSFMHLYNANHTFELPQTNTTHLRITKQQMGVGGINSWGAKVQPQSVIDQSKYRDFTCTLYISKKD